MSKHSPAANSGNAASSQRRLPDLHDIAAQLFVRAWTPGSDRTVEHFAKLAYEAAHAFLAEAAHHK